MAAAVDGEAQGHDSLLAARLGAGWIAFALLQTCQQKAAPIRDGVAVCHATWVWRSRRFRRVLLRTRRSGGLRRRRVLLNNLGVGFLPLFLGRLLDRLRLGLGQG